MLNLLEDLCSTPLRIIEMEWVGGGIYINSRRLSLFFFDLGLDNLIESMVKI